MCLQITPTPELQNLLAFEQLARVGQRIYKRHLQLVVEAIQDTVRWIDDAGSPDEQVALMRLLVDAKTLAAAS